MKKITYGGGNATKKTSKKKLNKVMPIKAEWGNSGKNGNGMSTARFHDELRKGMGDYKPKQPGQALPLPNPDNPPEPAPQPSPDQGGYNAQTGQTKPITPVKRNFGFATNDMIAGGLSVAAGMLPDQIKMDNQNHAPITYNPNPYGTGSQAIYAEGGTINKDNWNAFVNYAKTQPGFGSEEMNHDPGIGYNMLNNYNLANPNAMVDPRMIDQYQSSLSNSYSSAPNGYSKPDNFIGTQTSAERYNKYEYTHTDAKGNIVGHIAPTTTPLSQEGQNNFFNKPATQQPTQLPNVQQPTEDDSLSWSNSTSAAPIASKTREYNPWTEEDENGPSGQEEYSIDAIRRGKYGLRMEQGGEIDPEDIQNNIDLYRNGGILMLGEGGIKPYGNNAHSNPMMVSEGPSHEDGGMPINVSGQRAEIQGGEGVQQFEDGSTVIFGGMRIPKLGPETKGLAGKTIQSVAKNIAKEEGKNTKRMLIPSQDTEGLSPDNKFDSATLGSKLAMGVGYKMRSAALTAQKNHLRAIQDIMQSEADRVGVKYEKAHSIFAKEGAIVKKNVKIKPPVEFDPNDNPDPNPDPQPGPGSSGVIPEEKRAEWRKNMTDEDAQRHLRNRTGPEIIPAPVKYPVHSLADQNKLRASDILSEISYLGKRPDQVVSQQYKPYLQTPYAVSFQDMRNQNQSTFNEISRQIQGSGTAVSLAALAGQKYEADNKLNAEEFRTNQGIFNQVMNQNYNTLNDAAKFNTQLKDQQYVRQSQAKSNTDSQRAQALASISNKMAAKRYENMNIRLTEQRSGFRLNPVTNQMEWEGGQYAFSPYGSDQTRNNDPNHWTETEKYNPDTDAWEKDKRTRKATSKFGNVFGKK